MIRAILIFFCLLEFESKAQLLFSLREDSLFAFSYAGGDEFNATKIDENDWGMYLWPKTNMSQNFAYDPNNTQIENGLVVFTLNRKDSIYIINATEVDSNFIRKQKIALKNHQFKLRYAAGSIVSKKKYHYGLYELRFKIEKGKGVWPAFWFYGGNKNEEIDVFELKGERGNEIHVDTHCPYGCDRGYKNKLGFNTNWGDWMPVKNYLNEGFNLMMLDWRQNEVIWYINGYPLAHFKGAFPNPMNMFINTQVASDFSAFQPGPDQSTILPNNFFVDYVRHWTQVNGDQTLLLNITPNFTTSSRFSADFQNKPIKQKGLMYTKKVFSSEKGMLSIVRLAKNRIVVNVMGAMAQPDTKLIFKGNERNYQLGQIGQESEITIDDNEKQLELNLITKNHTFIRKINLN
jgi:beta-glucanase (GH16 family)